MAESSPRFGARAAKVSCHLPAAVTEPDMPPHLPTRNALLCALALASCSPVVTPDAVVPPPASPAPKPAVDVPPPARPVSLEPAAAPRVATMSRSGIHFSGVAFDGRSHRLVVVDQPGGPGSRFADAAAAARSQRGIAAVNGGFFTPSGEPLGLVVSEGESAGSWNRASSLGTGIWHDGTTTSAAISRRGPFGRNDALHSENLLQAGPLLVENGQAVTGLDAGKTAVRTVILWDGGHRWWIGRSSACSLQSLAGALTASSPDGWPVRHALNLDGGRSSDLWVSGMVAGGPVTTRPPWNRPVRNFLVLVARENP